MSDTTIPQRKVMHDFELDRLIEATQKTFDGWLQRVIKNGPADVAAVSELAACSARYSQLMTLKLGYLS